MSKLKTLLILIGFSLLTCPTKAAINDAFVLVDVSGTMKNPSANAEAKEIILEMLTGTFNENTYLSKGWSRSRNDDIFPTTSFLKTGSHVCIIPLGIASRVHDRTKHVYNSEEELRNYYNNNFPSDFKDAWTYLTLAKAYVGSVAVTDNISTAYVFIYTDGCPESTKEPYNEEDQQRVDDLQHAGSNSFKKVGCLRKKGSGNRHFDIEVWEFEQYKTIGEEPDATNIEPPQSPIDEPNIEKKNIVITTPKDGRNAQHQHDVKVDEELQVRWTGGAADVVVARKEGSNYKNIPKNKASEFYSNSSNATSAKIQFYQSGDYKISVRGKNRNGSANVFVSVTDNWIKFILPILLVIVVVLGGIYAYRVFNKKPIYHDGYRDNNFTPTPTTNSYSSNDDW